MRCYYEHEGGTSQSACEAHRLRGARLIIIILPVMCMSYRLSVGGAAGTAHVKKLKEIHSGAHVRAPYRPRGPRVLRQFPSD